MRFFEDGEGESVYVALHLYIQTISIVTTISLCLISHSISIPKESEMC